MSDIPPEVEIDVPEEAPWMGPPLGTLPAVLGEEIVLAQTDRVAVCVIRLGVYPAGFEFEVLTMAADDGRDLDPFGMRHEPDEVDETGAKRLTFGIEYGDGSSAEFTGEYPGYEDRPTGPVLKPGSGGGGGSNWHREFWAWPLPRSGRFSFVCEWPAVGIPLTRHPVDSQVFVDAAARSRVIFPEEERPPSTGWAAYAPRR